MRNLPVSYIKWTGRFFMRKNRMLRRYRPKRDFSKKMNTVLSLLALLILLPVLITILYQKMQLEELLGADIQNNAESEEQLVGIVAKEININAAEECIKAQSIIARTNLYAAIADGTKEPEGMSVEEMRDLWGEDFQKNYERLETYCKETAGKTLKYRENYIYAAYHAVSAGNTRNMAELFPDTDMPYLVSVPCHEDTVAPEYLSVNFWEAPDFLEICQKAFPEVGIESVESVQILKKDSAGYVLEVQVGQTTCSGEEFRNKLGLNSASFSIAYIDGNVRIVSMGLGHGLGLSQYTAEKMAETGKNYEEILQYFYPGAVITE